VPKVCLVGMNGDFSDGFENTGFENESELIGRKLDLGNEAVRAKFKNRRAPSFQGEAVGGTPTGASEARQPSTRFDLRKYPIAVREACASGSAIVL
jgi:hypothetical protein